MSDADDETSKNVFTFFREGAFARGPVCMRKGGLGHMVYPTLLVTLYMVIGVSIYSSIERKECDGEEGSCKWSIIDSIYFCTVTMSTVGYGDFSPTTAETKFFTILWILVGIVFVFSSIANSVGALIQPIGNRGRDLMEHCFPREPVDITGDGLPDYFVPRHWVLFYSKNLLPLFVIVMGLQLGSAAIFLLFEEWDYGDAVYHCIVTATTVGYGDLGITSDAGKMWAVFHIVLSVSLLGALIASIDELREERKQQLAKVKQLTRKLDEQLLMNLMNTAKALRPQLIRDGLGLTELEFVIAMLIELRIVEIGKVRPFIHKFRSFDVDGTGRLGNEDLEMMAKGEKARAPCMNLASRSMRESFTMNDLGALVGACSTQTRVHPFIEKG